MLQTINEFFCRLQIATALKKILKNKYSGSMSGCDVIGLKHYGDMTAANHGGGTLLAVKLTFASKGEVSDGG